eukprot:CAMPEP_0171084246 /NCGR_PEP_ID=MMETSP0766_2-20121228/18198_1 /TAXON_ID=439317 /ORGANISM="Gambierdiscus australes, Strain CAWD 149" /LENGTH=201 /DNA_ID=CAMNT_0011541735 /DNA_START=83 /DNA_END=688 /DNA_ORIENTATION=-
MALRALLFLAASSTVAQADSALEIVSSVKNFRQGAIDLFSIAAKSLKDAGSPEDAQAVEKWSDDWLSVLGVNKGITGLAKDFVVNYLGRRAYHDSNGPLINAIKKVSATLPRAGQNFDDDDMASLRSAIVEVCREGKQLFQEGGSLSQMLTELQDLIGGNTRVQAFKKGLNENVQVKVAFDFFSGAPPGGSPDEDINEEEL